ncbi:hypothetical protein ACOME3_006892 [Neoechinorhynchus agilis]
MDDDEMFPMMDLERWKNKRKQKHSKTRSSAFSNDPSSASPLKPVSQMLTTSFKTEENVEKVDHGPKENSTKTIFEAKEVLLNKEDVNQTKVPVLETAIKVEPTAATAEKIQEKFDIKKNRVTKKTKITLTIEKNKDTDSFGIEIGVNENEIGSQNFFILHLDEGGAAAKAGARVGDDIKEINGIYVKTMSKEEVMKLMDKCRAAKQISMVLLRNKEMTEEKVIDEYVKDNEKIDEQQTIDTSSYSVSQIRKHLESESSMPISSIGPKSKIEDIKQNFETNCVDSLPLRHTSSSVVSNDTEKNDEDKHPLQCEGTREATKPSQPLKLQSNLDEIPDSKIHRTAEMSKPRSRNVSIQRQEEYSSPLRQLGESFDQSELREMPRKTIRNVRNTQSMDMKASSSDNISNRRPKDFSPTSSAFVSPVMHPKIEEYAELKKSRVTFLKNTFENVNPALQPALNISFDANKMHRQKEYALEKGLDDMGKEMRSSAFHQPSETPYWMPTSSVASVPSLYIRDDDTTRKQNFRAESSDYYSIVKPSFSYRERQASGDRHRILMRPSSISNDTSYRMESSNRLFGEFSASDRSISNKRVVDKRELCANCGRQLGFGSAMVIPDLHLCFHITCFRCCQCNAEIKIYHDEMDVLVKDRRLSCKNCFNQWKH